MTREKTKYTARWNSAFRLLPVPGALKREPQFSLPHPASRIPFHVSLLVGCLGALAAEVDLSKLPPPATNQIEFARDIKPLLERSCFRCHGPERPKSRFSLATRESALKGGDSGV